MRVTNKKSGASSDFEKNRSGSDRAAASPGTTSTSSVAQSTDITSTDADGAYGNGVKDATSDNNSSISLLIGMDGKLPRIDSESIASIEDRDLVHGALILAFAQMKRCRVEVESQLKKLSKGKLGSMGMCCRHCSGEYRRGRFFAASLGNFWKNRSRTSREIFRHFQEDCQSVPPAIRKELRELQQQYDSGSEGTDSPSRQFFERVWARIHGEGMSSASTDSEKGIVSTEASSTRRRRSSVSTSTHVIAAAVSSKKRRRVQGEASPSDTYDTRSRKKRKSTSTTPTATTSLEAARSVESIAAATSVHGTETSVHPSPADQDVFLPNFIMAQMRRCCLSCEEKMTDAYRDTPLRIGDIGLCCRHCFKEDEESSKGFDNDSVETVACRFFPSTPTELAAIIEDSAVQHILLDCPSCPADVRSSIQKLVEQRNVQERGGSPASSESNRSQQERFFQGMWTGLCFENQSHKQYTATVAATTTSTALCNESNLPPSDCPLERKVVRHGHDSCQVCYYAISQKFPEESQLWNQRRCKKTNLGCTVCNVLVCHDCWDPLYHPTIGNSKFHGVVAVGLKEAPIPASAAATNSRTAASFVTPPSSQLLSETETEEESLGSPTSNVTDLAIPRTQMSDIPSTKAVVTAAASNFSMPVAGSSVTVSEMVHYIKRCRYFVTTESAKDHLAWMLLSYGSQNRPRAATSYPDGAPREKKILCLAMSRADLRTNLEHNGHSLGLLGEGNRETDILKAIMEWNPFVATVLWTCRGVFHQCYGRDLARCLATEMAVSEPGVEAKTYAVSIQAAAEFDSDRHITANFNQSHKLCKLLSDKGQFDEVVLDYFWNPSSAADIKWRDTLFRNTLPDLARDGILSASHGKIFLPFCPCCFKQVMAHREVLKSYYNISFLYKEEMGENPLWKGTQLIHPDICQHVLGKALSQEDLYCTYRREDMYGGMEEGAISHAELRSFADQLDRFEDIRFIKLEVLKAGGSTAATKGQILGLQSLQSAEKKSKVGQKHKCPIHLQAKKQPSVPARETEKTCPGRPEAIRGHSTTCQVCYFKLTEQHPGRSPAWKKQQCNNSRFGCPVCNVTVCHQCWDKDPSYHPTLSRKACGDAARETKATMHDGPKLKKQRKIRKTCPGEPQIIREYYTPCQVCYFKISKKHPEEKSKWKKMHCKGSNIGCPVCDVVVCRKCWDEDPSYHPRIS